MNALEIRDLVSAGRITVEQAQALWEGEHDTNQGELVPEEPQGIQHAPIVNVPEIQVQDREQLAMVRQDLALIVESTSVRHEYQRQMVEEKTRHYAALPIIAAMGIADGAAEGIGYSISEIAETFTYTLTRTARRIKEGFERGKYQ